MKRTVTLLLGLSITASLIQGCDEPRAQARSMEQIYREEGVPVRTEVIQTGPVSRTITAYAVLSGIQESTADAAIADRVDRILFRVGDCVEEGDVVVTFPTDNPGAQFKQAGVNFDHAKTTLDRMRSLYESGGISRQELDNTLAQFRVAEANWDAAQQAVEVRAPLSGVITRIDVSESDNVKPGDVLFAVARTQKLKARIWVPETQIEDIRQANRAQALWGGHTLEGRVVQVDMSLNADEQAFCVMVEFDNASRRVPSGVNAEVKVFGARRDDVIMVAREDVQREDDDYIVYVAENGEARKRPVLLGRHADLDVEVVRGLAAGDLLITESQMHLEDGGRIKIVNP